MLLLLLLLDCLSSKQRGNKKLHSTKTSIQSTNMILSVIDNKQLTAVVLLDMSKAFDSIDHKILLAKLKDVSTSSSAAKWFRSYLTSRYQVVRIYTAVSEHLQVVSSILGLLRFRVYVNDLPVAPQHCPAQCYVDDTKLLMSF